MAQGVLQGVLQALQADNQTSVRHLLEWAVVMLVARQPSLVSTLLLPALQPVSGHVTSHGSHVIMLLLYAGL